MTQFPQPVRSFTAKSANYTAASGDVVLATTGAGGITVTLPVLAQAGALRITKVDAGVGALTVKTSDGSTIDGVAGSTGISTTTQHTGFSLDTDGANWWVV